MPEELRIPRGCTATFISALAASVCPVGAYDDTAARQLPDASRGLRSVEEEECTHLSTRPLNSTTARTSCEAHSDCEAPLLEPFL